MKVMIVDDSSTIRHQVRLALEEGGHEVLEACDGVDGLEKITATQDLAAIVLDVNMPRMNGIELLRLLADQQVKVPVVMLTTEGQPSLIKSARAAGAKGWLVKPFKPELLLKAVVKLGGAS